MVFKEFAAFTHVFRFCKPKLSDYEVFDVDAGNKTDYNIVMRAGKVEDSTVVGEPETLIIAKEWILENMENILLNIPEGELE